MNGDILNSKSALPNNPVSFCLINSYVRILLLILVIVTGYTRVKAQTHCLEGEPEILICEINTIDNLITLGISDLSVENLLNRELSNNTPIVVAPLDNGDAYLQNFDVTGINESGIQIRFTLRMLEDTLFGRSEMNCHFEVSLKLLIVDDAIAVELFDSALIDNACVGSGVIFAPIAETISSLDNIIEYDMFDVVQQMLDLDDNVEISASGHPRWISDVVAVSIEDLPDSVHWLVSWILATEIENNSILALTEIRHTSEGVIFVINYTERLERAIQPLLDFALNNLRNELEQ